MQTKPSTGSGEVDAYRIEAKSTHGVACVGGIHYQEKWQEISLSRGSGIPGDLWSRYTNLADCLTHDQAWALAWAFKAQAEAEASYGIRVRVVRYKVKWSWSCETDGTASELPHKHERPELFKDTGELQEPE